MFDIHLRIMANDIMNFYSFKELCPNLLSISIIVFFIIVLYLLPKKVSKITLIICYIFTLILFIVNYMLLNIKGQTLSVFDLNNASEGMKYLNFILGEINIEFILILFISIVTLIISILLLNKININLKLRKKVLIFIFSFVALIGCQKYALTFLGNYEIGVWGEMTHPKYYYDNYINSNKSLLVTGLYRYTIRDINLYLKDRNESYGNKEEVQKLIEKYNVKEEKNNYSDIFKDKNLIMIMMESIDNIVVNKRTMPTLTYMHENGWNFTGRYTNNTATLSTEFTSLSGLYFHDNLYKNYYPLSLPNKFKDVGYITTSTHENNGEFYNRTLLHKNLGFQNSYFLKDILKDNKRFSEDAQIIENDDIYNSIISKDKKFMSQITTISGHGPYNNNYKCQLADISNDERACLEYLSGLTDDMLNSLLKRLKEDDLLKDTVIVIYSDHYPYSYNFSDKELQKNKKIDSNYNIKNLPFIIYAEDIESMDYDFLINDIDIVPTILNLFGIKYDAKYYIGTDMFSKNHKNLIMLNDYSWYDGNIYNFDNKNVVTDYFIETTNYTNDKINLNKMIMSLNYYKYIK